MDKQILTHVHKMLYDIGVEVKGEAIERAPVKTGALRDGITIFDDLFDDGIVEVGNTAAVSYAVYVHEGTKPHKISARKAPALRTPYGPRKSVQHPGSKPNPYLKEAVEELIRSGELDRILDDHLSRMGTFILDQIEEDFKKQV